MAVGVPFGDVMNGMRQYVVLTTLTSTDAWRNSTLIGENVADAVRKLKEEPSKNIYVDGSSDLVHTLAEHDLVDECSLLVYPLMLAAASASSPMACVSTWTW